MYAKGNDRADGVSVPQPDIGFKRLTSNATMLATLLSSRNEGKLLILRQRIFPR